MSCYKASGKIYIRNKSIANQPFQFIGNAQAVLNTSVDESAVPDYTSVAGGNACSDKIISKVDLALTVFDFKSENLTRAVQGKSSVGSVVAIVDEIVRGFANEFIPTANLIDLSVPPTVQDAANVITYVVGTDYTVEQGGIRVVNGGAMATAIAAGAGTPKSLNFLVTYTPKARDVIEALVSAGSIFEVLMLTQNRADSGKFGKWNFWAVDFGPTASLNIITREFGSLVLAAEVLPDATKGDGALTSTYFKIQNEA